MDLTSLLAYYTLLSGGVHPWGHVQSSSERDIPLKIDYKQMAEYWKQPHPETQRSYTNSNLSDIWGAGFENQDKFTNAVNSPEASLANAIYKLAYLGGSYKLGGTTRGDINDVKAYSGNKNVDALILASTLADLYKMANPGQNWDLNFTTLGQGTPGLMFNYRY